MRKQRLLFLFAGVIVLLFIFVSCDREELIEPAEQLNSSPYIVSSRTAVNVAESFINSDKKVSTRSGELKVKNYSSIKNDAGLDVIHVINYDGGGFVLISGDNRMEPILAYSELNSFGCDFNDVPEGLRIWIEGIKRRYEIIEDEGQSQDISIKFLWDKYSGMVLTRSLDPGTGIDPECDTIVGPLLTNTWHQYESYNDYLTAAYHLNIVSNEYVLHKPVIGCVPLSIARVLQFWGYPTSFPWSSMSSTSANHYTKTFLSDIHYDVKSYAESHSYSFLYYYASSNPSLYQYQTSVATSFPVGSFICSRYNYSSATTISYSTSQNYTIRREMFDFERPVIIGGTISNGSGHTWVCDGYRYKYEHFYDSDMNPIGVATNLLHHRWGEPNSQYDGWFVPSDFDYRDDGNNLNYYMTLTYQIQPY